MSMLLYESICDSLAATLQSEIEKTHKSVKCYGLAEQFEGDKGVFPLIESEEVQVSPDDNYDVQTYFRVTSEESFSLNAERGYGSDIEQVSEGQLTLFCMHKKRISLASLLPALSKITRVSNRNLIMYRTNINTRTIPLLNEEYAGYDLGYLVDEINFVSFTYQLTYRECILLN